MTNRPKTHITALIALVAIVAISLFCSCKTTEENYRAAYEKAIAKRDADSTGLRMDSTIYTRIRRQATSASIVTIGGDTLHYSSEAVGTVPQDSLPRETIKRFNIVVSQFKQIFNARSMVERLRADGRYPGAFIMQTREPLYYVVALGEPTAERAYQALRRVEADSTLRLRAPYPRVISPTLWVK